jgi:membrane associated rhomboid family serine protease
MPFIPLKDDTPRLLIRHAWVTWGTIALCCMAFYLQISSGSAAYERLVYALGVIPATVTGAAELTPELSLVPPAATLITSMFLHADVLHLIGNMLYLWVFGDNIEDSMGHPRFLVFYLLCGIVASLLHVALAPESTVPTIGASGAISGVLGGYLILNPRARVLVPVLLWIPMYIPAALLLVLWFVFQVLAVVADPGSGQGVAWWAHIGGFIAGAILVVPFRRKTVPLFGGGAAPSGIRMTVRRRRDPSRRRNQANNRDRHGPWG